MLKRFFGLVMENVFERKDFADELETRGQINEDMGEGFLKKSFFELLEKTLFSRFVIERI